MDKSKLIDKHLKGNHTLIHGNVHHFVVTGEVKGAFKGVLIEMLQEFEDSVRGKKTLNDALALPIPDVSGMSLDELHSELHAQEILYSTEKDTNKANQANWKMTEKYIINGKEIETPGKFSLSGVIQRTPQERLIELQQLYNSMEYEQDTNKNIMKCNFYMDEINEIVKLYPELSNTVKLKNYGF